jgi:hypothetical protein
MRRSVPSPPPGFDELPVDEKVQYVEALWDRIGAVPERLAFRTGIGNFSASA